MIVRYVRDVARWWVVEEAAVLSATANVDVMVVFDERGDASLGKVSPCPK